MPVVELLNGEQEEEEEKACGQCHEKRTCSQCSLKVTWLLQSKKKPGFSHLLLCCAIADMGLIKFWPKESHFCFLVSFLRCYSVYEET